MAPGEDPERPAKERESRLLEQSEDIVTDPDEIARIEVENGFVQFDAVTRLIQDGLVSEKRFRLRPATIMELSRLAVQRLVPSAGAFRTGPMHIGGSQHEPPPWQNVPALIDDLCDYVSDQWADSSAIHLASYTMWRINWIHPFADGNGRTARAISYLTLNVRLGYLLPGTVSVPDHISKNKFPYYDALEAADAANNEGRVDVTELENLLKEKLAAQLYGVVQQASRT